MGRLTGFLAILLLAQGSGAVGLPGSYFFDVESETGRHWRIFVSVPPGEVPESGFPVVYAADGNTQFLTMAETVSNAVRRPDVASGAIVVGIGYPDGIDAVVERGFDLTPTTGPDDSPVRGGGADVLLEFVRSELQPEIARRHDVDASREAWFGHSFGGLFGLYVYATRNDT
ncbi:MAG: alpha/beta hydrolase, partial [Proteobacteria bacterium]|nr:alpha/beta hydrolase [Pseudomonadota bacterium]